MKWKLIGRLSLFIPSFLVLILFILDLINIYPLPLSPERKQQMFIGALALILPLTLLAHTDNPDIRKTLRHASITLISVGLCFSILYGFSQLTWSLGLKTVINLAVLIVAGSIVLFGRDFFDIYNKRVLLILLILYGIAFLSMIVMAQTSQSQTSQPQATSVINFATPGTIFTLFIASVTVIGFTITITRLQESHVRISHYERFLLRLERLLKLTLSFHDSAFSGGFIRWEKLVGKLMGYRYDGDQEGLKILCSVPTLGNMSHHSLYLARIHNLWNAIARCDKLPVEMICIDAPIDSQGLFWSEIDPRGDYKIEGFSNEADEKNRKRNMALNNTSVGEFYSEFREERGFKTEEVRRGITEAFQIIREFKETSKQNTIIPYQWPPQSEPPMHIFWTRRRAIVAVPLDRDIPKQQMNRVTMVGYETTDAEVIDRLLSVYNEWRNLISGWGNSATQHQPAIRGNGTTAAQESPPGIAPILDEETTSPPKKNSANPL